MMHDLHKPLLFLLFTMASSLMAQTQLDSIRALQGRLMAGPNLEALRQVGSQLDDHQLVEEFLGYHRLRTPKSQIMYRLIQENTLFFEQGLPNNDSLTAAQFFAYLDSHPPRWSDTLQAYVVNDWRQDSVEFKLRGLSPRQWLTAKSSRRNLVTNGSPMAALIRPLWERKDPKLLLQLAISLYQDRSRFNMYSYASFREFQSTMDYLTHMRVAVSDGRNNLSFDLDRDFSAIGRLNMLRFWLLHYKDFVWNADVGYFESYKMPLPPYPVEADLLPLLSSDEDSARHRAFMRLVVSDPDLVVELIDNDAGSVDEGTLGALPDNTSLSLLKHLPFIVQYCRSHKIDFEGRAEVKDWERRLMSRTTLKQSLALEEEILAAVKPEDVFPLEFWAATHFDCNAAQASIGHILDQYYSQHWPQMIADTSSLGMYLRKADWFLRMQFDGCVAKYMVKFAGQGEATRQAFAAFSPSDTSLQGIMAMASNISQQKLFYDTSPPMPWRETPPSSNLTAAWLNLSLKHRGHELRSKRTDLVFQCSYAQIPEAIQLILSDSSDAQSSFKYFFLKDAFGLMVDVDSMHHSAYRSEFLENHRTMSKGDLYLHYLQRHGLSITLPSGTLNFAKIGEVLEYGLALDFMGGNDYNRYPLVYSVVKVLEERQGTRLGFPEKLSSAFSGLVISPEYHAVVWLVWLRQKGHLPPRAPSPFSFTDPRTEDVIASWHRFRKGEL